MEPENKRLEHVSQLVSSPKQLTPGPPHAGEMNFVFEENSTPEASAPSATGEGRAPILSGQEPQSQHISWTR